MDRPGDLNARTFEPPTWALVVSMRYFADYVVFAWHRNVVGLDPVWFHATILCLHLLNTWLVLTLLPKLGVRRRPDAMIAAFVFGLHPTTYTVTNWTALGFEELTVVMFTLVVLHLFAAFLARPRAWLVIAAPVVMFIGCGFKNLSILAYTDTVYGQSIMAMHPEKRLRMEYAKATATSGDPSASEAAASDGVVLLALDTMADENGETPRLYGVDRARWAASGTLAATDDGASASGAWPPFRIDGEPANPPCALAIRLVTERWP